MCNDEAILQCLQAIEDTLSSDQYEPGPIKTVGGISGSYIVRSPYNTECEWAIAAVVNSGVTFSTATTSANTLATISSAARATFSQQYTVSVVTELAIDFNVTALTGGASPTVTFKISRVGADGILYQLEQAAALSAAGVISYNIGAGADNKPFGVTIQVDMVVTGAPTSITFSGSIIGKGGVTPTNTAGFVAVSSNDPSISQMNPFAPPAFGAVTTGEESNAFDGIYIPIGTLPIQPFAPPEIWQPLGRGVNLFVYVNNTANSQVYVYVTFRRKLARYIPDKPRQQPHTHTHPQSRMHQRKLAAQSTMVAGYEEQYPVAGGKPFSHADPRSVLQQGAAQQQLAPGQDPAVVRKGVFSLGPTGRQRNGRR
jgi:hypothetical protein